MPPTDVFKDLPKEKKSFFFLIIVYQPGLSLSNGWMKGNDSELMDKTGIKKVECLQPVTQTSTKH